jgi:hypothetical protein
MNVWRGRAFLTAEVGGRIKLLRMSKGYTQMISPSISTCAIRSPVSWGFERNRDLDEAAGAADATAYFNFSR